MDLGLFTMRKEVNILDNGIKIKCKEEVLYTIQMGSWPTRANGTKINYMDMEFFIMNVQHILLR